MVRFHVCMPVVEDDEYRCFVCHRDMRAEMSEYDAEIDRQTKVPTGRRGPRGGRGRGDSREARLGLC
ncbi:MAG: hypothetical protein ACOYBY_03785 [Dermatophilaceae bacterium]